MGTPARPSKAGALGRGTTFERAQLSARLPEAEQSEKGSDNMTSVYIEKDGDRHILSAQGHATGKPEVCAAVSGLLYALAGYLANIIQEEYIEFYESRMESGDVFLDLNGGPRVETAFDLVTVGLLQIAKQHPEYIQVDTCKIS